MSDVTPRRREGTSNFPRKKTVKGWIFTSTVPDGWEELAEIGEGNDGYLICSVCKTRLCIGRDEGKVFRYCPLCLMKKSSDDDDE